MNNEFSSQTDDNVVDGFTDNLQTENGLPDAPDPGAQPKLQPMDPDERAQAEKEIREGENQ